MRFFLFSLALLVVAQVALAIPTAENSEPKAVKGHSKEKFFPGLGWGYGGLGYGGLLGGGLGYGGLYGGYGLGFLKGKKNHGKAVHHAAGIKKQA